MLCFLVSEALKVCGKDVQSHRDIIRKSLLLNKVPTAPPHPFQVTLESRGVLGKVLYGKMTLPVEVCQETHLCWGKCASSITTWRHVPQRAGSPPCAGYGFAGC